MESSPSNSPSLPEEVAEPHPEMDQDLLKAATSGDSTLMKHYACHNPGILLGKTRQGNSCLHIASFHGHKVFCKDVVAIEESLLTALNLDGETPLIAAVTSNCVALASFLLMWYHSRGLSETILKQDFDGCNALHHAISCGHTGLALQFIAAEPALSEGVNKLDESPMFIAATRGFTGVCEELLQTPDSAHGGISGFNALHAATRFGSRDIARIIMENRPWMARESDTEGSTPLRLVLIFKKIDVLQVLLEHDPSLGYEVSELQGTLLNSAALEGHVDVTRELLNYCPDAPYRGVSHDQRTCLHTAVSNNNTEFIEFILKTPQLQKIVNMRDSNGRTALHYAVEKCNPRAVATLLSHKHIDTSVLDNQHMSAARVLASAFPRAKTLNWNEVSMLLLEADPRETTSIYNLHNEAMYLTTDESRNQARSLTQTYTSNTSLVAILIATITFAAAFTLPGGYNNDAGSEGLPIMSKKFAFQAFLISDVIAMCSSFAVAFICIIARWEDYEFLLYYRSFTKKLMWLAFMATTTAFSTGIYTVLAPRVHWLAIAICAMAALLPISTWLLGKWPVLKLRFRLGRTFNSGLLDMV
uniref:Uncharacterized protein n=1 Tax=Avena sativa TaxID=4498 RepID=A0ACD5WM09_AVESA